MSLKTHTSKLVTNHVIDPTSYYYPYFTIPKSA